MEIEAKFRTADPGAFAILTKLTHLGDYRIRPLSQIEVQQNTYYDTADGRLQAQKYGLRIRQTATGSKATLKGPNTVRAGVHQREEWEVPVTDPHPRTWPAGAARAAAEAVVGDATLHPLITIETRRRLFYAERNGRDVAEISFDEGVFQAGSRSEPFSELEIELLPDGTPNDLDAIVAALREQMTLIPEDRSKLERGLLLRDTTLSA